MKARTEMVPAYKVEVYIGCDDYCKAVDLCTDYCNKVGLCVTVTQTTFAYTGGSCDGVIIGLINYARFPKESETIWGLATELAFDLKDKLEQGSFTVQDHQWSRFYSTRKEDGCA